MYPNYGYHVYLTSGLDDDGDGVLSSMEDSWWVNSSGDVSAIVHV